MDYFDIKKSQQIHNFFKRVKSIPYRVLAELHRSKDRELNALIIGQVIVLTILGLLLWISSI